MVFIANPDGADLVLNQGDRLGALVPAATQTRSCLLCGFVDTDAFVNDLTMCDVCGTLLPAGPMACRRCDAGPDDVVVRLYAGCAECKGKVHSVHANCEEVNHGADEPETLEAEFSAAQEGPGSSELPWGVEMGKDTIGATCDGPGLTSGPQGVERQDPRQHACFHIVEEPGGIRQMTDCEVPPAEYYIELLKDMVRRHPKACRHVLEHFARPRSILR